MSGGRGHEEVPRSEGDLRIFWDERDGRISQAWCQGTLYRGYEMILAGRHPEDALATTARLCGICPASHVMAATCALEDAWHLTPPPQAVRLRNLFLAAESVMSDAGQGALFFGPGLCHESFSWHPLYPEVTGAFAPPFAGWPTRWVRVFSKRILGVITAFTGQWPHAVPFRPGGAACPVGAEQIRAARAAVDEFAAWYAPTILGGPLDRWAQVTTAGHLAAWLDQHQRSVIGLFSRFATGAAGLHRVGHGSSNLLSGGLYRDPRCPRHTTYRKAHALALEAGEQWQKAIDNTPPTKDPTVPADLKTDPWNLNWVAWNNGRPNPFATEQFLAIELGRKIEESWRAVPFPADPGASSAEKFPRAVTITEASVRSQFARQLHRTAIEEGAAKEDSVAAFLADSGQYVAITQSGSYVRLAPRSAVLEGLVQQLLASSLANGG